MGFGDKKRILPKMGFGKKKSCILPKMGFGKKKHTLPKIGFGEKNMHTTSNGL